MKKYESIFIIKGRINQAKAEAEFEKILKEFHKNVNITKHEFVGKRKLAYSVKRNTEGYFCVIDFETENNAGEIAELETILKHNDNILKFITIKKEEEQEEE